LANRENFINRTRDFILFKFYTEHEFDIVDLIGIEHYCNQESVKTRGEGKVHSQIFSFHFASVKWRKKFFLVNLMRDHAKTRK